MSYTMKPAFFAAILAVGALFAAPVPATASPAASGLATSGVAGIAADANQVTEVGRRGRYRGHRHRGHRHRSYRRSYGYPGLYLGFGAAPFYYGYPYYYRRPYYAAPRYRRSYRGGGHCASAHRACVARWGYGGGNYIGCMRYERCRPR